jgi:hypothetical protein
MLLSCEAFVSEPGGLFRWTRSHGLNERAPAPLPAGNSLAESSEQRLQRPIFIPKGLKT